MAETAINQRDWKLYIVFHTTFAISAVIFFIVGHHSTSKNHERGQQCHHCIAHLWKPKKEAFEFSSILFNTVIHLQIKCYDNVPLSAELNRLCYNRICIYIAVPNKYTLKVFNCLYINQITNIKALKRYDECRVWLKLVKKC